MSVLLGNVLSVARRWSRWRRVILSMPPPALPSEFGDGIYTLGEAAAILGRGSERVSPRQVRYWVRSGLTPASYVADYGKALSFHDLISLEIVRRFRAQNVSLQRVRRLEERLRLIHEDRPRPLAYDNFFTDGVNVWAQALGEADATEIVGRYQRHLVWVEPIRTFAQEIRFAVDGGPAVAWGPSEWVELDPSIQFGAPVIKGTRIPVSTIQANLSAGSVAEVAEWYGLTPEQVRGGEDYIVAA